ncbi:hypothetical protein ACIJYD_03160 [Candidatus Pelagibacter bacterium nBUS_33]|uniref:hypothetical protein n=1 Tax=Candidatus Pelagibacter bacterium nBUS_33 TaxID=3374193 RepID=UPI003EB92082
MKNLLLILILTLSFHSWSKADDIRDLQIEGMSIGDSLLDFFNKNFIKEILAEHKDLYKYKKNKTFVQAGTLSNDKISFANYEYLQFMVKKNDKKYIIHGISGKIFDNYEIDIKSCYKKQDEVVKNLKNDFLNTDLVEPKKLKKHQGDKTGKSTVRQVGFFFKNDDVITIECYDWAKVMPYKNNFKISLSTDELNKWFLTND